MSVTVHLPLSPNCKLRRDVWQADQQGSLDFGEALERHLAGGSVNAVAGLVHYPSLYLAVGVSQTTELAQGQEASLYKFDARFHDSLFLRIPWRACIDLETVSFCALAVRALYFGLVVTRPGDRTLAIVDDDPGWHAPKCLKGAPMTSQPGCYRLVSDKLDILVARPRQGHDEEPSLVDLAGKRVGHHRPGAEINLRRFGWLELQAQRHVGRVQSVYMQKETIDRGIAAAVSMVANERGVDRRALNPGCSPLGDLLTPRFQG